MLHTAAVQLLAAESSAGNTAAAKTSLTSGEAGVILAAMLGGAIAAGIVIAVVRSHVRGPQEEPQSVVRSWLTLTLIIGLLAACVGAFELDDSQLRNLLLGGLVASVGTAVAFYFSAKSTSEAVNATRGDLLGAMKTLAQGPATPPGSFIAAQPHDGQENQDYAPYPFVADGTSPKYERIAGDELHAGLVLAEDGTLSGRPTEQGTRTFTVRASNAAGHTSTLVRLVVTP